MEGKKRAPEGDRTNMRLDWGESGPELIVPPLTQAKKLGYAIDGIRGHVASIGLLLTDKTLSADALADTILALQKLSRDWDGLEKEKGNANENKGAGKPLRKGQADCHV